MIEDIAPYSFPSRHESVEGAEFFIFGCKDALDAENEWFYDSENEELFVYRENGELPKDDFFVKTRMNAFDFSNREHIEIHNINIIGSSIITNENTENLLLNYLKIMYPYYSSQANSYYGTQSDKGVSILGENCVVQNSEIAFSTGVGILLAGINNKVLNCFIHDTDIIGTYASCIQLRGKGNVVSHCTLTRSGRTVIDYSGMYQALIQNCDMSHSGLLTSDLGLTYGNVIEGGNSEVRFNLLHDNEDDHMDMGLYYDHGTQNIISHHNIVWGIENSAFHTNHYAAYHLAYNNTFISENRGFHSTWGNDYGPDLLECRYANNLFSGTAETTAGNYYWNANITGYDSFDPENPMVLPEIAKEKGIKIEGITRTPSNVKPSVGAVEFEGMKFIAGYDFENPPEMSFERSKPLHRNLLKNTAFENEDHFHPWKEKGSGVEVIKHNRKIHITPDTAIGRMGDYSVRLHEKNSEIFQSVVDLVPEEEYVLTGHLRVSWRGDVVLGVRFPDGTEFLSPRVTYGAPNWSRCRLNFTMPESTSSAEVFIRRRSEGNETIYVDDFGLVRR
jgi:hypothetical protein